MLQRGVALVQPTTGRVSRVIIACCVACCVLCGAGYYFPTTSSSPACGLGIMVHVRGVYIYYLLSIQLGCAFEFVLIYLPMTFIRARKQFQDRMQLRATAKMLREA